MDPARRKRGQLIHERRRGQVGRWEFVRVSSRLLYLLLESAEPEGMGGGLEVWGTEARGHCLEEGRAKGPGRCGEAAEAPLSQGQDCGVQPVRITVRLYSSCPARRESLKSLTSVKVRVGSKGRRRVELLKNNYPDLGPSPSCALECEPIYSHGCPPGPCGIPRTLPSELTLEKSPECTVAKMELVDTLPDLAPQGCAASDNLLESLSLSETEDANLR